MTIRSLQISYIIVLGHAKLHPFQAEVAAQLLPPLEQRSCP